MSPLERPLDRRRAEARAFGRHLVGADPDEELIERYARACELLFPTPPTRREDACVAFAVRHPLAIGCLDTASGLLRPESLLRRKLLLMAAVLETTPRFAEAFLPRARSIPGLALVLVGNGCAALVKALAGAALLPLAERRGA